MLIGWLTNDKIDDAKLLKLLQNKIKPVTVYLGKLQKNNYSRILANKNILKPYLTAGSWTLVEDFEEKKKNKGDPYKCNICNETLEDLVSKSNQCCKCLLGYHVECFEKYIVFETDQQYLFCSACSSLTERIF